MCNGFALIVTQNELYWIEPDTIGDVHHSKILERLGWKDSDNQFTRRFVRVEYDDWTPDSFRFDERGSLPGWVDEADVRTRCDKVLARVAPLWAEYEKVYDAAWAEFEKVRVAPLWAEYEKVYDAAWAEYEKVRDAAWAEYEKVRTAAHSDFVKSIQGFTGYVHDRN